MSRIALMLVSLLALGGMPLHGQGEIIDRVLAVVEGEVLTWSDVDAAIALGLLAGLQASDAADARGVVLDRLIERELTLREVRRYLPPEPSAQVVEAEVQAIREQFASPDAFAEVLSRHGFDERRLAEWARDDLRIAAYLGERFASVARPTAEEASAYYYENLDQFTTDGRLQPLDAVIETIRARLEGGRRNAMIADWRAGLRRRAEVTELGNLRP